MKPSIPSCASLLLALAVTAQAGPVPTQVGLPDRKGLAFGEYDIYGDLDPTLPLHEAVQARAASTVWTDVTTPALACTVLTYDKKGVAFVDWDGDGDHDLCAVGEGARAITLFRNDGGSFLDVTPAPLTFPASGSSQTWGDYDNDGDPDFAVFTEEARHYLFRNDGAGAFTNVTPAPMLTASHGHSSSWVDFDRDGRLDLYVANMGRISTTPSRLFRGTAPGSLVDATADSLGVRAGDGVAWGDYDNDGDPDVFLARFLNAQDLLLRNDAGTFVDVTGGDLIDALHGHSCAWADYDNDLDLDLFVANANGPNRLYRNDGGVLVNATPPAMVIGIHSVGMVWGDYDNDGRQDLFLTLTDGAQSRMFHNDGGGVFSEEIAGPLGGTGSAAAAACADYDEDGDLDLYVSSYLHRASQMFRNGLLNGNHWLEVDLEGTLSNRSALGARVYVESGGTWQMREVAACTGYRSQSAMTTHFGLGSATVADRVRVHWPSGMIQQSVAVAADQRIRIIENTSGTLEVGTAPAARDLSLQVAPNPFTATTRIAYRLGDAGRVRIEVLDLAGRVVRSLENDTQASGRHERTWDGADDGGRHVAEGIYFVRVTTPSAAAQKRVVAVRR